MPRGDFAAIGAAGEFDAWAAGVERLHAASRGRLMLTIVRPAQIAALLTVAAGDPLVGAVLVAANDFLLRCGRTPCLHCPAPLARPGAVGVVFSVDLTASKECLAFGFCRGCALPRGYEALCQVAIAELRRIWPDLCEIAMPPAGHA